MTDTKPTIDEQIAYAQQLVNDGKYLEYARGIFASLERLKAIDAVQVPDEPDWVTEFRSDHFPAATDTSLQIYIDTLRDLLKRESADAKHYREKSDLLSDAAFQSEERAEAAEAKLAATKRLLAEARDDVAELLERMKTEGWHRDDRIECHVALLSRIDTSIKEQK
jgi:hypothetical protein